MKMYGELADWFHLLTAPEEYAEEAAAYRRTIVEAAPAARTLLELGSGGGNNASHLKAWFECTLTDRSEPMLAVSRRLNPECEHLPGDMRTLRLGRTFDVVFVHDALMYLTTEGDLRQAMQTTFVHLAPGGVAVFVPDFTLERLPLGTHTGGNDGDGRSLRYLEWTDDRDPRDTQFEVDYVFMLRDGDRSVRVVHERHECGVFPEATWLRALRETGFAAPEHRQVPQSDAVLEVFVARRGPDGE